MGIFNGKTIKVSLLILFILFFSFISFEIIKKSVDGKNNILYKEKDISLTVDINKFHRDNSTIFLFKRLNYTPQRVIPFWFWNGNLSKKEITRQIELMQSTGIKEVIIHARSGLVQEYLSEEWFEFVGHALKELQKKDMKAWIYDEFDWPSGIANGKVLEKNPNLIAKNLKMKKMKNSNFSLPNTQFKARKIVSVIFSNIDNTSNVKEKYCNNISCSFGEEYKNNSIYVFYQDYGHFKTEYKHHYYVDLMNPNATLNFINLTHEEYYRRFPDHFGNTIVGFFTDEPGFYANTYDIYDVGSIAWSNLFEKEFYEKKGYNITNYVYYLWYDDEGNISEKVKRDYFEVRTDLYVENYFKTIHDWTSSHKVLLTGHVLIEENLYDIVNFEGDFFRTMEYLDIPGTDDIIYFDKNKITPILVSSAEFIYNKPYSLTETFAGYGWDLTYNKVIATTNWLIENGVDIIVPHAFFYTTEGEIQYNDYPPSFFFQNQDLWTKIGEYIKHVNNKKNNKITTPALVVYPLKKSWSLFDPINRTEIEKIDYELKSQIESLEKKGNSIILIPDYVFDKK